MSIQTVSSSLENNKKRQSRPSTNGAELPPELLTNTQNSEHWCIVSMLQTPGRSEMLPERYSMDTGSTGKHRSEMTAVKAGFPDPFDELAARPSRSGSCAPPASSHQPVTSSDPLDALWRDPLSDPTPPHSPSTEPAITFKPACPTTAARDWERLGGSPGAHTHPRGAPPAAHTASMGDLLGLGSLATTSMPENRRMAAATAGTGLPPPSPAPPAPAPFSLFSFSRQSVGSRSTGDLAASAVAADTAAAAQAAVQGAGQEACELLIYAIPLMKGRLVFLPVARGTEQAEGREGEGAQAEGQLPPPATTQPQVSAPPPPAPAEAGAGAASATTNSSSNGVLGSLSDRVASFWRSMAEKQPGTLGHTIYSHGNAVLENQSAEERLMRNIPDAVTKLVINHPTTSSPEEVAEQLTKMASQYALKSTGKAVGAGLLLPVAFGAEMVAVPLAGWFMLYQLYKATSSLGGGQRLNKYLSGGEVRVCYAPNPRLDKYVERSRCSPDGLLGGDDLDDLVHELGHQCLAHPLAELRNRYLKRVQTASGDYALLPATDSGADEEGEGCTYTQPPPPPKRGMLGSLWGGK